MLEALRTPRRGVHTAAAHLSLLRACVFLTLMALGPQNHGRHGDAARVQRLVLGTAAAVLRLGRMFWPVYYLLFWVMIRAATQRSAQHAIVVLAVAVGLQTVDLLPMFAETRKACGLEYREDQRRALREGDVESDTLYVMAPQTATTFVGAARVPVACVDADQVTACVVRDTYVRWQDAFEPLSTALPHMPELEAFYIKLDELYRSQLQRQPRTVSGPHRERLQLMMRYWWYRTGRCSHLKSVNKVLQPAPVEVRICGSPFCRRHDPSVHDFADFHRKIEGALSANAATATLTHVDPEGDVVWTHCYITERLNGRDAYGSQVDVMNAVAAIIWAP